MTPAPIALFVYNRPEHTQQTVDALRKNALADQSRLLVFSDGPRTPEEAPAVDAVRTYLGTIAGFRSVEIVCAPRNLGLADSIIGGVSQVCRQYGRVIVVEDDLVTSSFFLRYMNEALELYERTAEIISIHGYLLPICEPLPETFFLRGADCWGWATWQRGWELFNPDGPALLAQLEARQLTRAFDFNRTYGYTDMLRDQIAGRNNSWAIRWYVSAFLQNKLTLYPGRSLVGNIGLDASGTHCGDTTKYQVELSTKPITVARLPPRENAQARQAFEKYFASLRPPVRIFWRKFSRKASAWFGL